MDHLIGKTYPTSLWSELPHRSGYVAGIPHFSNRNNSRASAHRRQFVFFQYCVYTFNHAFPPSAIHCPPLAAVKKPLPLPLPAPMGSLPPARSSRAAASALREVGEMSLCSATEI